MIPQEFLSQWPVLAFFASIVGALLAIIRQQYVGTITDLKELLKTTLAQLEKERADHNATREKATASLVAQVERVYGAVETLDQARQDALARAATRRT